MIAMLGAQLDGLSPLAVLGRGYAVARRLDDGRIVRGARDVHPGDWMAAHALEARTREQRCESCHRGQSFCRTCHLRAGVAQGSPPSTAGPTAARVHEDPAWASGLEQTHGREARRAIQTCVSCHAGRDCVTCHAFVNPHPPGFESRCRSLVAARARSCTACHDSLDGLCD